MSEGIGYEELQRKIKDLVWMFARQEAGAQVTRINIEWEKIDNLGASPILNPSKISMVVETGAKT